MRLGHINQMQKQQTASNSTCLKMMLNALDWKLILNLVFQEETRQIQDFFIS